MPEAHSKYGASSAHRWLNCPGSIQLSETVPKQSGSKYALEGTAAHKLGELCLTKDECPSNFVGLEIELDDGSWYEVTAEMTEAVDVYVRYVREQEKLGESFIETRFSLDSIHEGMFGTNDACVYSELLGILEVIDYKHGAGIAVSPEENTQLAYYGLGAAEIHDLHPESQIKLTIVQPRAMGEPVKSWTTTVGYLGKYAKTLKKGVKACQDKKPKLAEGDWCRFCPAQAVCPQLEKKALEVARAEFSGEALILPEPSNLNIVDIKRVLDFSGVLSSWLKAVESYAFNELESGREIEGYKLVKKRATRKWADEVQAEKYFRDDVGLGDRMYSKPKLLSPAQVEKLKVDKNLVAQYTAIPDSGNTMVPVSDKRPEVVPSIQSDFAPVTAEELG